MWMQEIRHVTTVGTAPGTLYVHRSVIRPRYNRPIVTGKRCSVVIVLSADRGLFDDARRSAAPGIVTSRCLGVLRAQLLRRLHHRLERTARLRPAAGL